MLHRYDPDFKGFYNYVCAGCGAENNAKAELLRHKPDCHGEKVERVFGGRLARAVVLQFLNGGEDNGGLPFTYAELAKLFPEAVASAERSVSWLINERAEDDRLRMLKAEEGRLLALKTLRNRPKPAPRKPVQLSFDLAPAEAEVERQPKRKPVQVERRDFAPHLRNVEKSLQSVRSILPTMKLGIR